MTNYPLSKFTGQQVVQYYDPSGPAAGDMFWSMASSREGCYIANGADYAQADEPELFAAIGTAFNTQINPTTGSAWAAPSAGRFRVPDMRGVVPRGAGTPHNGSALAVGAYEADQMQGHKHDIDNMGAGGSTNRVSPSGTGANPVYKLDGTYTSSPVSDGANGTPRTGGETRGKARGGNWFIRRFNPSAVAYGAGMVTAVTPGLVPPRTPRNLLAVTCAQAGFSLVRASISAYQDQNGVWQLRFNIYATFTSAAITSLSLSVPGVEFRSGVNQACSGGYDGVNTVPRVNASPGSGNIVITSASTTTGGVWVSGDVELNSKPSWA